jgi:manganese/zinc/iron transport system substrate-binding protein
MNKLYILLVSITFFACSGSTNQKSGNGKTTVVATTGIIANALDSILPKDKFEILALMGPGTDPHLYKPTPRDVQSLKNAPIIVANGLHLEGKMNDILHQLQRTQKVLFVSDGISESTLIKVDATTYDPHIWFAPNIWSNGIAAVVDSISTWNPNFGDQITTAKLNWQLELLEIENEIKGSFDAVDSTKKYFVTAHDAFSYYAKAFDIKLKALQGISTQSEFGLKEVTDLAEYVVKNNVTTVYFESSIPKKSVEALKSACLANGHEIGIDGPLYSDALGSANSEAGTYFDMLYYNSRKIISGMQP